MTPVGDWLFFTITVPEKLALDGDSYVVCSGILSAALGEIRSSLPLALHSVFFKGRNEHPS
jgi:hypothetical protein